MKEYDMMGHGAPASSSGKQVTSTKGGSGGGNFGKSMGKGANFGKSTSKNMGKAKSSSGGMGKCMGKSGY